MIRRSRSLAVAAAVLLAACGGDDDAGSAATSLPAATATSAPAGTAEPEAPDAPTATSTEAPDSLVAAFPITLEQPSGAVTIEEAPERIYVVDAWGLDLVTALGVVPVGASTFSPPPSYVDVPGFDPSTVTLIDGGLNVEAIAATRPDLIVDASGFFTQADTTVLGSLSGVAPVLGPPSDYLTATWQERFRHIATALGRVDEAEALIADTDARLAEIRGTYPELVGAAVTFGQYLPATATFNVVAGDEDFTRAFLNAEYGFTTPAPQVEALESGELEASGGVISVALERVDLVVEGADAAMLFIAGDPASLDAESVWTSQPLVSEGRAVLIGLDGVFALRTPSPAAVGYTADNILPALAAAIAAG